jgi:A/G-specific adenine glycosylase
MLQQTQVPRVIPKYEAFLERFPNAASCAASPVADVIRAWSGLGYNRRAVALHSAARQISELGRFPESVSALCELPGVGPYTARAVLAFAFETDVAIVDTNIARVLARTHGRSLTAREAQRIADALVPAGQSWAWNQALMDIGATICTSRAPDCDRCPLSVSCVWRGGPSVDPAVGSAFVSRRQSRFAGSDRQGRGYLLRALSEAPVTPESLPRVMGWPDDASRAEQVAATLVTDGLAVKRDGAYRLP